MVVAGGGGSRGSYSNMKLVFMWHSGFQSWPKWKSGCFQSWPNLLKHLFTFQDSGLRLHCLSSFPILTSSVGGIFAKLYLTGSHEKNKQTKNTLDHNPRTWQKGKQKSPGRPTSRSRSQPPTPGGRENVTQINVCIANKQIHDNTNKKLK